MFKIDFFIINNFMIQGLQFKRNRTEIKLKQNVEFLVAKNKFNSELEEFAKLLIDFWHCFRLETYYENYRLVFKMDQSTFDEVLKSASVLEQKVETDNIVPFFGPIVDFFITIKNLKKLSFISLMLIRLMVLHIKLI
ncbi:hypothetical protein [Spiroplasma endosymbiont of Poecilobothrus nobilitatus]|uniref:hypothetical protein n=1 Tax=Spiroplasma endosymbiont of Poecilobothrus nobilitatus TaxID=1209220 RepID=UPI00313DED94